MYCVWQGEDDYVNDYAMYGGDEPVYSDSVASSVDDQSSTADRNMIDQGNIDIIL